MKIISTCPECGGSDWWPCDPSGDYLSIAGCYICSKCGAVVAPDEMFLWEE